MVPLCCVDFTSVLGSCPHYSAEIRFIVQYGDPTKSQFNYPHVRPYSLRVVEKDGEVYVNVRELKTMVQQSIHQGCPPEWTTRALVRYMELILCQVTMRHTWRSTEKTTLTMSNVSVRSLKPAVVRWRRLRNYTKRSLTSSTLSVARRKG